MQSKLQFVFRSLKLLSKNINTFSLDYDEIYFRIIINWIIVKKNYIKLICGTFESTSVSYADIVTRFSSWQNFLRA